MGRSKPRSDSNARSAPPASALPAASTSSADASVAPPNAVAASAPATTSSPDTDFQEQLEFLTSELDDRDQVIAALTAQLEGAVEQLDRLHRQGADRGGRSSAAPAGLTQEILGEQRAIADRMSQWLDQWDQLQPTNLWLRMEARLEELATHLGSAPAPTIVYQEQPHAFSSAPNSFLAPAETPSMWEEAKQRVLDEFEAPDAPAPLLSAPPAQSLPEPSLSGGNVEFPEAIDLETAGRDELVRAVELRDRYISDLTHRLRTSEMRQPIDWEALSQAPADLRKQLETLETRYRDHMRREECDLALERARLAREQARLKQDRHRFEQEMRRSGLAAEEHEQPPAGEPDDRSWLKVFGRKK